MNNPNPVLTTTPTRPHAGPGRPRGSTNAAKAAAAAAAAVILPQQPLIIQPPQQQQPTTSIKINQLSSVPIVQSNPSTPRSKHSTPGKHKHKSSSNMVSLRVCLKVLPNKNSHSLHDFIKGYCLP